MVKIERENQTLATVTLQNYFRMYDKLAGMTGTADTEAAEFDKIYKLDVVVIPTNRDMIRKDEHDVIFRTEREKFDAVVEEIVELYEKKQPALVGTISIEKSEYLGQLLKKRGVPHVVLNAKYHEQEATIVAQAGQPGRMTIATNMAGRGTDILLGGNPEFLAKQRSKGKTPEEYAKINKAWERLLQPHLTNGAALNIKYKPNVPIKEAPKTTSEDPWGDPDEPEAPKPVPDEPDATAPHKITCEQVATKASELIVAEAQARAEKMSEEEVEALKRKLEAELPAVMEQLLAQCAKEDWSDVSRKCVMDSKTLDAATKCQ